MFWRIAAHEVGYRFRTLSTYVYFLLLFALSYLLINAAGGAFGDSFVIGGTSPNTNANSPYVLTITMSVLSLIGVIITAAFMGRTIYRDYESGIHPLLFTTPVRKLDYLGGRFVGALAVNALIFLAFGLGLMLGEVTPWLDADQFGPFRPAAYALPYLTLILPNLVVTGALFFALAATTRKMLPNYVGGIFLFLSYNLASLIFSADAIENSDLATLLDPFGIITLGRVTRYWTVAQQNTELILPSSAFLMNRLLWLGLAAAVFGGLYARFRMAHLPASGSSSNADAPASGPAQRRLSALITQLNLPAVHPSFDLRARWQQYVALTRRAFTGIVRDVYFYAIVGGGILFLIVGADEVGKRYGTEVYPLTRIVADALVGQFALFIIILIAFYAGQLVWRERDLTVQPLHDALPIASTVSLLAKGTALVGMVVLLLGVVMVVGMGLQLASGFTALQPGLYVQMLFGVQLVNFLPFCVLALTVHVLVNHKYTGHFLIVLYFVGLGFFGQFGLEHRLYRFGAGLSMPYSDMNGFGHFPWSFTWFALHWGGVAVLMALATRLGWVRGLETTLAARLTAARRRLSRPLLLGAAAATVLLLGTGTFIVYNTTVLNTYRTSDEADRLRAAYEKRYGRYADRPQPRITAIDWEADFYPSRRDAAFRGRYTLVNTTETPIDSVHVNLTGGDTEVDTLAFDRPAALALDDDTLNYRIYALGRPLPPGDTLQMDLELAIITRGFPNGRGNTALAHNGTFLNSGVLPSIGYNAGSELSAPDTRADYGLPPKPRMPPLSDSTARRNTYIGSDADWIDFRATVSTAPDQIVLAPGRRVRSWTADGRRYATYEAAAPMLNFYTFLSARYDTAAATWRPAAGEPVDITVYHHPAHAFNLDRMIDGTQAALDYFTTHFGPYQNDHVRIAEFPRYQGGFAQSFLGTIPYSESIGFIARVQSESDIDYPFYVTAHEVAHQWWAHQVVGAHVEGATVLSETLCQYSALMVMKDRYGEHQMRRFLEYELDQYLSGRSREQRAEPPLVRVNASQGYIHYRKGANVMYALQDYIGEEQVNRALRRFVETHRFTEPPYPVAPQLVRELEAVTPDSLQYVLDDWFRTVTLYENRTTGATYAPTDDGRYRVTLDVTTQKVQADSLGAEAEVAMNDWIDVGVFPPDTSAAPPEPIYLRKHQLESGEQTITVTVDAEPARAGIDPYATLIDRDTGDNVTSVARAAANE